MELFGLDVAQVFVTALAGVIGAGLTYLATRRQSQVSERTVYIGAVEKLTADLRREIERVNADRQSLTEKVEALEARIDQYEEGERALKRRLGDLEAHEQELLARIEQLERERDRLREDLTRYINGSNPEDP